MADLPDNVYVSNHPLIQHKLSILRDKRTEPKKFRELIREISILLAYEATADLRLADKTVETPMGTASCRQVTETIGLVPVLRAGLGMVEGIWEMMPGAEVWHIGLFRDERTLRPVQYYNKLPVAPTVQVCLILDPMLATGGSAVGDGRHPQEVGRAADQVRRHHRRAGRRRSGCTTRTPTCRSTWRPWTSG